MRYQDWTKILGWPGYQVFQHEIDESTKKLICSGCGKHCVTIHDTTTREVRDLPWGEYRTTVVIELHCVPCPDLANSPHTVHALGW